MADILTHFYDDSYQMRFLNLKKPFFNDLSVQTAENVKNPKIVFDYISETYLAPKKIQGRWGVQNASYKAENGKKLGSYRASQFFP